MRFCLSPSKVLEGEDGRRHDGLGQVVDQQDFLIGKDEVGRGGKVALDKGAVNGNQTRLVLLGLLRMSDMLRALSRGDGRDALSPNPIKSPEGCTDSDQSI